MKKCKTKNCKTKMNDDSPEYCPKHNSANFPQKEITFVVVRINPIWLRAKREKSKLSLREVARRLKISASYLSDIERGNGRYPSNAVKIFYEQL